MADEKLVKYIQDTLEKGFSQRDIDNGLIMHGYSKEVVDAAFIKAYYPKKDTPSDIPTEFSPEPKQKLKSDKKFGMPVAALIFSFIPFLSIVGLILGILSLVKIKKDPSLKGKGMAIAAIILSFIMPIIIAVVFFLVVGLSFTNNLMQPYNVGAIKPVDVSSCGSMIGLSKDICYMKAAKDSGDVSICDKVSDEAQEIMCIQTVAINTKNAELCGLIENSATSAKCVSYVNA